ncbi:Protein FAR-RED IMPAIRED RESPONSE 1 [Bienertia sinuspersici]
MVLIKWALLKGTLGMSWRRTSDSNQKMTIKISVTHIGLIEKASLFCALESRESAKTYEWVFSSWLNFMGGKVLIGTVTDQAPTMLKAIALTILESRHKWCIWHIT